MTIQHIEDYEAGREHGIDTGYFRGHEDGYNEGFKVAEDMANADLDRACREAYDQGFQDGSNTM